MAAISHVASSAHAQPHHKKGFIDLRSIGLLAKWPIIGLMMFIFGSLMFGALTVNLRDHGPLLAWDSEIANTLPPIGLKKPSITKTRHGLRFLHRRSSSYGSRYTSGSILHLQTVLAGIGYVSF